MRNPILVLLGGFAILAILAAILPKKEGSKLEVGTEVSYWMNVSEPGEGPSLKPLDATVHAVHGDGTVDLIVSAGKGNYFKVGKAERSSRALAGYWTPRKP